MIGKRVLVVDDEPALRRAMQVNLEAQGYTVDLAPNGEAALASAASHRPDVVVLDLGLPGIDGLDVIDGLRGWTDIPIIVLSARDAESQKVRALDAGADDYVTKPFGIDEVLARVRSALRRSATGHEGEIAHVATADFDVDLVARRVHRHGDEVHLTPTEWAIVELLVRNRGRLVTQQAVLHQVWGPQYDAETHYLRVFLNQIRRKLEPDPSRPRYFITEPGMGYRFEGAVETVPPSDSQE